MIHKVKIAGRDVELAWTVETSKRFAFRMGLLGGEPIKDFSNPKKAATALFKVLWGLLPAPEFARYADPESLFVAVDHDNEAQGIFDAITAIYGERFPTPQKKSTTKKSRSRKSNSG